MITAAEREPEELCRKNKAAAWRLRLNSIWNEERLPTELAAQQARESDRARTKQHHAARLRNSGIRQARDSAIQLCHGAKAVRQGVLQHQFNLVATGDRRDPNKVNSTADIQNVAVVVVIRQGGLGYCNTVDIDKPVFRVSVAEEVLEVPVCRQVGDRDSGKHENRRDHKIASGKQEVGEAARGNRAAAVDEAAVGVTGSGKRHAAGDGGSRRQRPR